jgi:hypothetical protein
LKTKVSEVSETTAAPSSPDRRLATHTITVPGGSPGHATVLSDMTNTASSSDNSLPKSLNLTSGCAGEFVTGMLQRAIKNEKNAENLTKRHKDGRTLKESLSQQENKRFSAGSLFKANRVADDSELLECMEEKEVEVIGFRKASISKHANECLTNKKRAEEVLSTSKKAEVMNNSDLKALVKWKKRKGDDKIPSTKPLLLQRHLETMERMDQTLAQCLVKGNGIQQGWI